MNDEFYLDLGVAVLAGGASRRFGGDKALYRFDGSGPTLIEHSIGVARQLSNRVAIIGPSRFEALDLGVLVLPDDVPGRGPLGGIQTALQSLDRPRVLVLGCDMPCLSLPLLRWMASIETEADVVIPLTDDGRYQPMHAIYRRSALPAIQATLAAGDRAAVSFFPLVAVHPLAEAEIRLIDPQLDSLMSVNSQSDIGRARRCVSCR